MRNRSLVSNLAMIFQFLPLYLFRFLEKPFLKNNNLGRGGIFILCLPRSGSTLTFQAVCHGLKVAYFSNLWHAFYHVPFLGKKLSEIGSINYSSNFKSNYGYVSGLFGPAEGLKFWSYWLGCGLRDSQTNTLNDEVYGKRSEYIEKVIRHKSGRPFASAYIGHSLIPDRVSEVFHNSVFIRLKRDPIANALSLYKAYQRNKSNNFSAMTKEVESFNFLNDYEKAASQVYWLNKRLDSSIVAKKSLAISYEDICNDPMKEIERIKNFCDLNGVHVDYKFKLPNNFKLNAVDLIHDNDAIRIREEFSKLESKFGKLDGE
jgi:hypothetical protein